MARFRGHAIRVEWWWLRLARQSIKRDKTRDFATIGAALARHMKGSSFSGTAISNFVRGTTATTIELVEAICKEYKLPKPIYVPRSYVEAVAMDKVSDEYADVPTEQPTEAEILELQKGRRPRRTKRESAQQQLRKAR